MDLASRKLALIESFLNLEDVNLIESVEKLLNQKTESKRIEDIQSMSLSQFHKETQKSLKDSENDNGLEAHELLEEIKNWK